MKLLSVIANAKRCRAEDCVATYDAAVPDAGAMAAPLALNAVGETVVVAVTGLNQRIQRNEAKIVRELKVLTRQIGQRG